MLIQPPKKIPTLALNQLEIPGRTEPPLPSGEWGINLAAAIGNFPEKGLQVYAPEWTTQGLGDLVRLMLNGNEVVDQHTLTELGEVGERVTLWVPPGRLQTGPHTLVYQVTRLNQGAETSTPPVRLYVKLDLPGGQDTDPLPGQHSNLFMAFDPPEVVNDGVDRDTAKAGVKLLIQAKPGSGSPLPYPNIAVGDVITASWGGILVKSLPVTAAQISDPATNPLFVQITEATILAAGDSDDRGLAVTYNIHDLVNNAAEDWCPETRIVVGTSTTRLDAPIIQQTEGDVLDLNKLGDANLIADVWASSSSEFNIGDIVIMHIKGTTLEGEAIDVTAREPIVDLPKVVAVTLPNSAARALAKTQAVFFYELERGASIVNRSKGRFVNIIGEARQLAAPIVENAAQGALDPDLPWVQVRFPYDPAITTQNAIELKWVGTRPDGSTYDPELAWIPITEDEANDPNGFITSVEGKHLKLLEGGSVEVWYNLLTDDNGNTVRRESRHASLLTVGAPQFELVKPIVLGEANGKLEPRDLPNGAGRLIAPRPTTNPTVADDVVTYTWVGEVTGSTENSITLTRFSADQDVPFTLTSAFVAAHIEPNRGKTVTASYRIVRAPPAKPRFSNPLTFVIGEVQNQLPVATFREATGPQNDQLNPSDVFPTGATVIIPAAAELKTGDVVLVTFEGIRITTYPHTVLATEQDRELASIKVPHTEVVASEGRSVNLSYVVTRRAGGTDGPSTPTVYDVKSAVGPGILRVMGARFNRSIPRASKAPRTLSAFHTVTGQALEAQWKYPNDLQWTTATTWRDHSPQLPLQVRTADDQITLNPANIIGSGSLIAQSGGSAFVAHLDTGNMVGWGNADSGASIPSSIITLDDIVEVSCTGSAYAARRINSAVVTWGNAYQGGNMGGLNPLNFVQVVGNGAAFAGIKNTRSVVAWGSISEGGVVPRPIAALTDVVSVVGGEYAFAALRATGAVVAWGNTRLGGTVPDHIARLTDIQTVIGSESAFAAHRANGSVLVWGDSFTGGVLPGAIAALTDIVHLGGSTYAAFTALRATGQVVAWGAESHGGTIDLVIGELTDIVEVSATSRAFAALRGNGHVVAWGTSSYGGAVPPAIALRNDIVQVCGSGRAFAALCKDGSVVAWGDAATGGDTSRVAAQLTQVLAIYSNWHGFTALTADRRVVTWGDPANGGDSSAVQDRLVGKVSYHANAVSRGQALKASRLAADETQPKKEDIQ